MTDIFYTKPNEIESNGITIKSKGALLHKMCRALIDAGHDPQSSAMVYRGDTLVFKPSPLQWWADRDTSEGDSYSCRFVKHKEFDASAVFGK